MWNTKYDRWEVAKAIACTLTQEFDWLPPDVMRFTLGDCVFVEWQVGNRRFASVVGQQSIRVTTFCKFSTHDTVTAAAAALEAARRKLDDAAAVAAINGLGEKGLGEATMQMADCQNERPQHLGAYDLGAPAKNPVLPPDFVDDVQKSAPARSPRFYGHLPLEPRTKGWFDRIYADYCDPKLPPLPEKPEARETRIRLSPHTATSSDVGFLLRLLDDERLDRVKVVARLNQNCAVAAAIDVQAWLADRPRPAATDWIAALDQGHRDYVPPV
jgi:hypothetical protein